MDDVSYVLVIRLGPKTSECEKNVTVVSTVSGCDVTNCATTLHGFNKHHQNIITCVFGALGAVIVLTVNVFLNTSSFIPITTHHQFCVPTTAHGQWSLALERSYASSLYLMKLFSSS